MGPDCERSWILGVFGVGDGQGGLACYNSWARKESDTTELLNLTELKETKDLCMENYKTLV